MDSDESRPGSSASNSSSSSADSNENIENGSPTSSRKSRSKSMNSNSSSSSSSRNNSNEDDRRSALSVNDGDQKSLRSVSQDGVIRSRSASAESNQSYSSNDSNGIEEDGTEKHQRRNSNVSSQNGRSVSRNQSISPVRRNSKSSRNSSVSSVASDDDEQLKADDISDNEIDVSQWAAKGHNGSQDGIESVAHDAGNDSNHEKDGASNNAEQQKHHDALNMSHEDLSDVSDLESAAVSPSNESDKHQDEAEEEEKPPARPPIITDLRQKLDERKNQLKSLDEKQKENDTNRANNKKSPSIVDELKDIMDKKHDEDALDFEAEDGECNDESSTVPNENRPEQGQAQRAAGATEKKDSDGEIEEGEELEEGEVSDEDEKRPEETEPKPVCRFYTRGQCTWGMSCRFLHPGVTDKGNYTMFDMIRPVPVSHTGPFGPGGAAPAYHDYRSDRPPIHHQMHPSFGNNNAGAGPPHQRPPIGEPLVESAWERGLRTAKEMMRKANKRKEQDMDFEDKKMNLSASQDELEKDNYYIRERSPDVSPPPMPFPVSRPPIPIPGHHANMGGYSPPPKYGPGRVAPPPYEEDAYGRSIRYRELPPHRMPQYEDEMIGGKRRIRPAREVIVQRVEPPGRGDEWNDPWMRSKSPGRSGEKRQKRDRRSYSSNSSYSSSSSSQSGSSSNSSRSPSPTTRRRRYSSTNNSGHKSPVRGRHAKRSPSPELHKRRHSPVVAQATVPKELHFDPKKDLRNHSALTKRNNPNAILVRRSPPVSKKRQLSPPIAIEKRVARSPPNKRKRPSPPPPTPRKPISFSIAGNNLRKKKRSSSSGSGSSDSSASESGTSYSSSSSSSSHNGRSHNTSRSRDKIVSERKSSSKKAEASKKRSPPPIDGKLVDAGNSSSKSNSSSANSKKTTRREELLKQLRAVEDAIARKRSKLN